MTDHLASALYALKWGAEQSEQSASLTPGQCRALRESNALTYICVPYSSDDTAVRVARFNAANRLSAILMSRGEFVFSPISMCHPIAEAGDLPKGFDFWQALDRIYLAHSKRVVVLTLDGWRESVGVTAELWIAREFGLPVSYVNERGEEVEV